MLGLDGRLNEPRAFGPPPAAGMALMDEWRSAMPLRDDIRGACVAVGVFGRFHPAQWHVLDHVRVEAARADVPAVVVSFRDPRQVVNRHVCAEALPGIRHVVTLPFSLAEAGDDIGGLLRHLLVDVLAASKVVVAEKLQVDGHGTNACNAIRQTCPELACTIAALEPAASTGAVAVSACVSAALSHGYVETANRLLGYRWFHTGTVVHGDQRGRTLGFPTANIELQPNCQLAQGIYAVRARLGGRLIDGVASYGKPMFNNHSPPLETNLFDFEEDLYGQTLSVALVAFIRGQSLFSSLDELKSAMDRDKPIARRLLGRATPLSPVDARLHFTR